MMTVFFLAVNCIMLDLDGYYLPLEIFFLVESVSVVKPSFIDVINVLTFFCHIVTLLAFVIF